MASKTPPRHSKTHSRPSMTHPRTSKTPPRRLQDASKMLQDASKRPPDALKTAKITFKTPPRPPNTSTRGFQMPPRRSSSTPRPLKPPQEASTCLQDAQYRFQDPPKCSSAAPRFYFLARFMPSPCQFPKYARDVCPQRPSTMADCQIRGCLPRVVWRWFARVGRLRSARTPWCFSGVFKIVVETCLRRSPSRIILPKGRLGWGQGEITARATVAVATHLNEVFGIFFDFF